MRPLIVFAFVLMSVLPCVGQAEPPKEPTAEQRKLADEAHDLSVRGAELYAQGQPKQAQQEFELALQKYERAYPVEAYPDGHERIVHALINLTNMVRDQAKFEQASRLASRALGMAAKLAKISSSDDAKEQLAVCHSNLASILLKQEKVESAERHFAEAKAIWEILSTKEMAKRRACQFAAWSNEFGIFLAHDKKYSKAIPHYRNAAKFWQIHYSSTSPLVLRTKTRIAKANMKLRRFQAAEQGFRDVLKTQKELHPQGDSETVQTLISLADVKIGQRKLVAALEWRQRAAKMCQEIASRSPSEDNLGAVVVTQEQLGDLYREQGRIAEARQVFEQTVELVKNSLSDEEVSRGNRNLAVAITNYGIVLMRMGQYREAETQLQEAAMMLTKRFPLEPPRAEHDELIQLLRRLGTACAKQSKKEAGDHYRLALRLATQRARSSKSQASLEQLAVCKSDLGAFLVRFGQPDEAETHFNEALQIYSELPSAGVPKVEFARCLHNLFGVYEKRKEFGKAQRQIEKAVKLRRQIYPSSEYPNGHPELIISIHNLGAVMINTRQYEQAEPRLLEAKSLCERLYPIDDFPDGHPLHLSVLERLGRLALLKKDTAAAANYYAQSLLMRSKLFENYIATASENEAFQFAGSNPINSTSFYLSAVHESEISSAEIYRHVWAKRNMIGRAVANRLQLVQKSDSEEVRAKYSEYQSLRREISRTSGFGATFATVPAKNQQKLKSLAIRKEALERELSRNLPGLSKRVASRDATPEALAAKLPADAAFLDLCVYAHFAPGSNTAKYGCVVFVVRNGQPLTHVVYPNINATLQHIRQWRKDIEDWKIESAAGRHIYTDFWSELEPHLKDVKTIYLCPDGLFCTLPWGAIPTDKGDKNILLDRHAFAVVPHGAALIAALDNRVDLTEGPVLAIGDLDYASKARALPATASELKSLQQFAKDRSITLKGQSANTGSLVANMPKSRLLHFATHGYFNHAGLRSAATSRNPLLACCLVLSNGQIWTGEAIAAERLGSVDLVVLSACESGSGKIILGEGLLGLQRAFHTAGAKNVVSCLWKVDDHSTSVLVDKFYRNIFVKQQPPIHALRNAQLEFRSEFYRGKQLALRAPGRAKQSKERIEAADGVLPPAVWAGMVLSGTGQ